MHTIHIVAPSTCKPFNIHAIFFVPSSLCAAHIKNVRSILLNVRWFLVHFKFNLKFFFVWFSSALNVPFCLNYALKSTSAWYVPWFFLFMFILFAMFPFWYVYFFHMTRSYNLASLYLGRCCDFMCARDFPPTYVYVVPFPCIQTLNTSKSTVSLFAHRYLHKRFPIKSLFLIK